MYKCNLINLQTSEIIKAKSVAEFCRLTGMNHKNDLIHIYPILRGERLHHQGWATLKTFKTRLSLKDIYGNEYKGTIGELLFNYKIPANRLWTLMTGDKKVFQGLFLSDTKHEFIPPKPYRVIEYQFKTPNNKIIKADSYRKAANKVNNVISYRGLNNIVSGRHNQVKGYTFHGVILEQKSVLDEMIKPPLVRFNFNRRKK